MGWATARHFCSLGLFPRIDLTAERSACQLPDGAWFGATISGGASSTLLLGGPCPSHTKARSVNKVGLYPDVFQFIHRLYDNYARSVALEDRPGCAHKLSDIWHQLRPLIGDGHLIGDREITVSLPGQDDQRRTTLSTGHGTFEVEVRRGRLRVLQRTGNIPHKAFDGHVLLAAGIGDARLILTLCGHEHRGDRYRAKDQNQAVLHGIFHTVSLLKRACNSSPAEGNIDLDATATVHLRLNYG